MTGHTSIIHSHGTITGTQWTCNVPVNKGGENLVPCGAVLKMGKDRSTRGPLGHLKSKHSDVFEHSKSKKKAKREASTLDSFGFVLVERPITSKIAAALTSVMVACTFLPLSIFTKIGMKFGPGGWTEFKSSISQMDSPPSGKRLRKLLLFLQVLAIRMIILLLRDVLVAVSFDAWSSGSNVHYIGVVGTFLYHGRKITLLLGLQHAPGHHKEEDVVSWVFSVLDKYRITSRVINIVHDNEPLMNAVGRNLINSKRLHPCCTNGGCVVHNLELITKKVLADVPEVSLLVEHLRTTVRFLSKSVLATGKLREIQLRDDVSELIKKRHIEHRDVEKLAGGTDLELAIEQEEEEELAAGRVDRGNVGSAADEEDVNIFADIEEPLYQSLKFAVQQPSDEMVHGEIVAPTVVLPLQIKKIGKTRWWSVVSALSRVFVLLPALKVLLAGHGTSFKDEIRVSLKYLCDNEPLLRDSLIVLSPIASIEAVLESEAVVTGSRTVSLLLTALATLKEKVERWTDGPVTVVRGVQQEQHSRPVVRFLNAMRTRIEQYVSILPVHYYHAYLADPRFRGVALPSQQIQGVITGIVNKIIEFQDHESSAVRANGDGVEAVGDREEGGESSLSDARRMEYSVEERVLQDAIRRKKRGRERSDLPTRDQRAADIRAAVVRYTDVNLIIPISSNPLEYFDRLVDVPGELLGYFRVLMICDASSAASERCFSTAGLTQSKLRNRMHSNTLEACVFTKHFVSAMYTMGMASTLCEYVYKLMEYMEDGESL